MSQPEGEQRHEEMGLKSLQALLAGCVILYIGSDNLLSYEEHQTL